MVGLLASLAWLTLGAFAIGTEGFMIAGLLPALAHDLDVGLPAAGNCSETHLHRYLAEFDFLYSNRVALGTDDRARPARCSRASPASG